MIAALARFFGSANDRVLRTLKKPLHIINALEPELKVLSDQALRDRTDWLRERLDKGETLHQILPDAFATVREAAWRTLGQRPYDVQMMGGMVLNHGMICEMRTGEGKTLVATLPSYLNALSGKGVHIVTVNDYLAERDSAWMGEVHRFLGLSVGCILHTMDDQQRRAAYGSDITYVTNHELGFDYLRDNMKFFAEDRVQRPFNYAIVDEVDSILIDEARTPLIISGPSSEKKDTYLHIDTIVTHLSPEHFEKDEKQRNVTLTEVGAEYIENELGKSGLLRGGTVYDRQNIALMHHVNQSLKAHALFRKDVDYIVKDDKIIIIDEFTGRMMEGRRYSDGLHQALEAKEHVAVQEENQTLASITYQNLFRLYPKLSGMTGTAMTEASEFQEIYNLEVVEIPTNKPVVRKDVDDEIYRTAKEKLDSIVKDIQEARGREQPILVGTVSIEKSEELARILTREKIPHRVLNARFHDQEAKIIAEAGRPGAVTIATNMAGRGTDIQLGGNFSVRLEQLLKERGLDQATPELEAEIREQISKDAAQAREAGGLFVIGTERHESRRIDNQLRGRSGRQGDPGRTKFFLSLEDDLMRIFGSPRMDSMLQKLGLQPGEAITHPWVTKALEKAQKKVEARNFDIRKHLLKYDDVMNDQRKVIYEQRLDIMKAEDLSDLLNEMRHDVIDDLVRSAIPEQAYADQWDVKTLKETVHDILNLDLPIEAWAREEGIADREIRDRILQTSDQYMADKAKKISPSTLRHAEKNMLLRLLDQGWKDNLQALDYLREGINLRAYAQRDPLNEYKQEAFGLFSSLLHNLRLNVTRAMAQFQPQGPRLEGDFADLSHELDGHVGELAPPEMQELMKRIGTLLQDSASENPKVHGPAREELARLKSAAEQRIPQVPPSMPLAFDQKKYRRNDPCPCGSGKKFKDCHGKI